MKTLHKVGVLATIAAAVALACTIGGNEGDVCNPLVERDECQGNLHCTQTTCTDYFCCPPNASSNSHCNVVGCPDASDEGGDAGAGEDGGGDAAMEAANDATDADADAATD